MARRRVKYQDKPYVVSPEVKARIEALMKPKPEKSAKTHYPPVAGAKKWELWRWDSLEDVPQ